MACGAAQEILGHLQQSRSAGQGPVESVGENRQNHRSGTARTVQRSAYRQGRRTNPAAGSDRERGPVRKIARVCGRDPQRCDSQRPGASQCAGVAGTGTKGNTTMKHLDSIASEPATLDDLLRELRLLRGVLSSQSAELLPAKAASRLLGISVASLYRIAASDEKMRPVKVGTGSKRWRRADLQKYISGL